MAESGHCVVEGAHPIQRFATHHKGISARVLSGELKDLEINGLVKKVVITDPKHVLMEYEPTEYSKTLKDIILLWLIGE